MYPRDIRPGHSGALVLLLEQGERCGPGEIGAVQPDRWRCVVWTDDGTILQRDAESDLIGRPPSALELMIDAANYPLRWHTVTPPKLSA